MFLYDVNAGKHWENRNRDGELKLYLQKARGLSPKEATLTASCRREQKLADVSFKVEGWSFPRAA